MRIPPMKSIVAFESVSRNRSVSRAAEELGLTASAVSHQLANLEEAIGQPLFFRQGIPGQPRAKLIWFVLYTSRYFE